MRPWFIRTSASTPVLAPRDSTSIKFVEFSLQLFHHALPHAFEARLNGHEPCFMGSL
jgi:hypothetical protein